ncbi:heparinase II/III family protein [Devosia sp.]|uniref:heparinase II/III family protein n=1 Tax=Devosia sp. TaxID=1871048 RepID=UPI003BAA4C62
MRLAWIINRLRAMGPAEIAHRVVEQARKMTSRRLHRGWARYKAAEPVMPLSGLREAVLGAAASDRAVIAAAAARLLAGEFEVLGQTWPPRDPANLFPPELWRLDPVTGTLWPGPETYCFDIDFRHAEGRRGDVKYVWELNRLQLLQPLAAHALLTGDTSSLTAIEAAIASWHAANPPYGGVGWASGIEVALRAISLLVVTSLVGDRFSAETHRRISEVLAASAFWLARYPSNFSSANNHLVAELGGEFLIAEALGRPNESFRDALIAEIDHQILPDGSGAEQTPTYAAFTVELALLAAAVAKTPLPERFNARLAAFAEHVHWLGGAAPTPALGDNDEGRVLTLLEHEADYPRSVAAAIAGHLKLAAPVTTPDFRGLILGRPTTHAASPEGLRTFPAGGLSVWHGTLADHTIDLSFDHGPLGYLSIAAHGHADALAITLAIDGRPVLVDPGTYLYGSGGAWRRWFRGTPAHNTLNLDGLNQSIIAGPFNWSHKAQAQLDGATAGPNWSLSASHDGYLQRFGVRHRRTISRNGDALSIADSLDGAAPRQAEIVFQLAPDLTTSMTGAIVTVFRDAQPVLHVQFPSSDVTISAGTTTPESGGWVSSRFGSKHPAQRIAWHGLVGTAPIFTLLRLPASAPLDTPRPET